MDRRIHSASEFSNESDFVHDLGAELSQTERVRYDKRNVRYFARIGYRAESNICMCVCVYVCV